MSNLFFIDLFIDYYDIPPRQAYSLDTGLDIPATSDKILVPRRVTPVPTDIYLKIPRIPFPPIFGFVPVFDVTLRSRSGLAKHGIIVANSPATIDTTYTGEVIVLLLNSTDRPYEVRRGDYIAQMVVSLAIAPVLSNKTRDYKGFGSSDKSSG